MIVIKVYIIMKVNIRSIYPVTPIKVKFLSKEER